MNLDLKSITEADGKPCTITIEQTTRVVLQYPGSVSVTASGTIDTGDPLIKPTSTPPTPTPTPTPTPAP